MVLIGAVLGTEVSTGKLHFFEQVDLCCKHHDECGLNLSWEPNETKLGITNPLGYTLSKCVCDRDFYVCLDGAIKHRFVGQIIKFTFKVVTDKCAEFERKLICSEFFLGRCQLYKIDPKSSTVKFWQIIDNRYLKWIR